MLQGAQLADAIRQYPGDAFSSCAWQVFWDYKCGVEAEGRSILDAEHRWETALQLMAYLCCFGMARAATRLAYRTVDDLDAILGYIEPEAFAALQAVEFEHITRDDEDVLRTVWAQLKHGLDDHRVSSTDTMLTKMLMGLWGEIPAFDTLFVKTYRRVFGSWHIHTMDVLEELRDEYHNVWQADLNGLEDEFTHTRRGHHNPIPVARLIDMGFWRLGSTAR